MSTPSLLVALFSITAVAGCGATTALDDYSDGGFPSRLDGGTLDGGRRDAGRDSGPPTRCTSDFECDNGRDCDGFEACIDGLCRSVMPPFCEDVIACTIDECVEGLGCVFTPDDASCPPGTRCDPMAGCVPTIGCIDDFECDDGRVCNGFEACIEGRCTTLEPPFCDDGIDCTIDRCDDALGGCVAEPDSFLCPPDAPLCDPFAGCVARRCRRDVDCSDGDLCNGMERCEAGLCRGGPSISCADMQECTIDFCNPMTGGCESFPESDREICGDRRENDCDGLLDCDDPDCAGTPGCGGCVPIAPNEIFCLDGRDDDCDGLFDCADRRDCGFSPECGGCMPVAMQEISCFDGRDDDCDGLFDCADRADCAAECGECVPIADREVECFDMRDDDCDGLFSCDDPDCARLPECGGCEPIAPREIFCRDGRDDDCDLRFDCDDPDCAGDAECCVPSARRETICNNGRDEDCDGRLDCSDPDCGGSTSCALDAGIRDSGIPDASISDAGPPPGDGSVCSANELGVAACTNGRDDDCDGRSDCRDPDCTPFGPMGECCNDRDDDGDGVIDVFTCRCFDDSTCVGVGDYDQVCWESSYSVCAPRCNFYGGDSFCRMWLPDMPRCNIRTGECVAR